MELYNADTGGLFYHVEPIVGQSNEFFGERRFLSILPCLWGDMEEGLARPENLSLDSMLLSMKCNCNILPQPLKWQTGRYITLKRRRLASPVQWSQCSTYSCVEIAVDGSSQR